MVIMQPVSNEFNIVRESQDISLTAKKIELILGNYASHNRFGVTISSTTAAANYPASKMIDGYRSELDHDKDGYVDYWKSTGFKPAYTLAGLEAYGTVKAFWQFEDAATPILDETANNYDGTYNGALCQQAGIITFGLGFDGVDDESTHANLEVAVDETFTVMLWFYPTVLSRDLMHWQDAGAPQSWATGIFSNTDGSVTYHRAVGGGWNSITSAAGAITINNWHCVIWGYNATTSKMWLSIDGAAKTELASGNLYTVQTHIRIGSSWWVGFFVGQIDETCMFSDTLTDSEIVDIYSAGAP